MPSRNATSALIHIRYNIVLVDEFIRGLDSVAFTIDPKTFYATTRALEIISEASRSLPDELKRRHPDIPWRQIQDAGNVYRHVHEEAVASLIWQTATERLDGSPRVWSSSNKNSRRSMAPKTESLQT